MHELSSFAGYVDQDGGQLRRVDNRSCRVDVVVVRSLDAGDLAPRQRVYRCPIELYVEALGLKRIDGVLGVALAAGAADCSRRACQSQGGDRPGARSQIGAGAPTTPRKP
jgi:hypothetical protein